ncbi:MAG TPA: hypothetical protein VGL06_22790 [Pseudonocardiaceae bacterium]
MRQAMRRAIGIGGATFVAVGAVLVLTLPASAHIHTDSASCVDGKSVLDISLTEYNGSIKNSVTITETDGNGKVTDLHTDANFGVTYVHTFTEDGTVTQSYHIVVVAPDDTTGKFSFDHTDKTPACVTTTTTTVPPTTTASPTTTTAVVAAATTTGAGTLPFTGVNATFPLLIAGVLVIAGGGILLWLRLAARRRRTES